ncbi:hypothetical protein HYV72_01330, partial [Candidatus Uhrbacteria bacterium]|nr:hypothetical protein [Candidatus Uhrbacteria bacterium]
PSESLFESPEGLERDEFLNRVEREQRTADGTWSAESFGKTSFGAWMQTQPGTESALTFTYVLPDTILEEAPRDFFRKTAEFVGVPTTVRHSLLIQQQPGVGYRTTRYAFDPGNALHPVWSSEDGKTQFTLESNEDGYFGMLFER